MMTKKIYFLLAFLLLIGGGKLWAATDVIVLDPFTSSEVSANAFSREGSLFTVSVTGCNYLNTSKFQLGDGTQFVITPSNSNVKVLSIGFTNVGTGSNDKATCTVNGNSITGNTFLNDKGEDNNPKTCTWDNNTDATSFTILFGKIEGNPYAVITSITITYQVMYRGSMPYTWDFDSWPLTTSSMMTANENAKWTTSSSNYLYQLTPSGAALVDGNNDAISETSGLTFTATTAGDIWTDLNTGVGLKNNASVTIPAKTGQKIAVHAWWPAEEMRLTNAEYTSDVNTFTPSSGDGTYEFTATADNVTLQANTNNLYIYSIAVTKNDLTEFVLNNSDVYKYDNADYNSTKTLVSSLTFDYDDAKPFLRLKLNVGGISESDVDIVTGEVGSNTGDYFTITSSSNTDVISLTAATITAERASKNRVYLKGAKVLKPGTSELTFNFTGTDAYNAATCKGTITVNKLTPTVTFTTGTDQTKAFSTNTYTNAATASNEKTVTYTSSNTNVATVSDKGVVTFHNSGVTKITASVDGDEYYNAASASYTLTVNGSTTPELTWTWTDDSNFPDLRGSKLAYGHNAYCFATAEGTDATVQYKSSNTKIATVDVEAHGGQANACKITSTGNGEVTITAYVEGKGDVNPAEVSFTMTIEGQEVHMSFQPTSGTVKVGKTITPYISVPDIKMEDITSVTVTTSDASKATVTAGETTETSDTYTLTTANGGLTSYTKDNTEYLEHIYATIKGEAITSGAVTITVTVNSDIYKPTTATYQVTVNVNDLNFNWEAPSQTYTLYTGDYMMIPAITGNANGNWSYSKGSTCESEQAYLYDIKSRTPTWNNRDFKIGEGIPDYRLYDSDGTTVTDKAYIVWVNGQSVHTDVLMIYAKTAGTVKLHAKDPQTGASPVDITINIINKSTLTSATTSYVNNMSFPYTWSFVGESSIAAVSPNYWEDKGDYYTCGMSTAFNFDYCDEDNDGNTGEALKGKYFVDENGIMPQFYGMTVEFGNSGDERHSYKAKEDKLRLYKYDSDKPDQPLLLVVGGTHKIALPAPGAGCPSNYKLFVKAKSRKNPAKDAILQAYWSDSKKPYYSFTDNNPIIFSVDVTSGDPVKELWVSDVDIYWIAMSTEAKSIGTAAGGSDHMASYSYSQTMDYGKSFEANEVDAYVATAVTAVTNEGSSSNPALKVTLAKSNTSVPSGTGVVLKADAAKDAYMIADARNVDSYKNPEAPTANLLIGTGKTGCTIYELAGDPTGTTSGSSYVPFYLSSKFRDYSVGSGIGEQQNATYYAYWRVYGTQSMPANYSYMVLDAATYKDTYGKPANINEGALSRILLAFDESDDDSGTTGIENVRDSVMDSDAWYTLQGVKVNAPAKGGIYIHKGKKVVVK